MMPAVLVAILQILFVPALSPLFVGITRKLKARLQNRAGASVWQPYRDLWKLFQKDEVISADASWLFRVAPYAIFAVTLLIGASLPLLTTALPNLLSGDFLVIVYLVALSTFLLALAGMDVGGPFGGFGSSREMLVAALTEGGLVLSLLTLALISPLDQSQRHRRHHCQSLAAQLHADSARLRCLLHRVARRNVRAIPSTIRPRISN